MIEYRLGVLLRAAVLLFPASLSLSALGKAGLSSTSQQLQLLQQVQRAQNLHATLAYLRRRQASLHALLQFRQRITFRAARYAVYMRQT
jgi:hypothetical protein